MECIRIKRNKPGGGGGGGGADEPMSSIPWGKKIISVNEKKRKIKKEIYQEVVEVVVHWCLFHLQ